MNARRFFAPEVVQTSAMDCGPAALKCLLEGFGVPANYARLREACQTAVDGTSIDTLEEVAGQLGLEVEQVMLPREHLLLPEAESLPALVVVTLPSGITHFVVVWRRHGGWAQVMDPGRGRVWSRTRDFVDSLYLHEASVPEAAIDEWMASDGFRGPLAARMAALGVGGRAARLEAAGPGWRGLARLEAAVRAAEACAELGALPRDRGRLLDELATAYDVGGLGAAVTTARPDPTDGEAVILRGAVVLKVKGTRPPEEAPAAALQAVLSEAEPRPGRQLLALVGGKASRWVGPVLAGLALAAVAVNLEALLFRALFDIGRRLGTLEQRAGAILAFAAFAGALIAVELPVAQILWERGRALEMGLRRALAAKLPRLGDRYLHSRPIADLAERAHLVHRLGVLPGAAGDLVRALCELVATAIGIAWLHPPSGPLAFGIAALAVGVPLLFAPLLIERDLRMRNHAGGLSRYYLDALLGLVAIRAHAAERAVLREHEDRLTEWARAAGAANRAAVAAEAVQAALGFGLVSVLLFSYLRVGEGTDGGGGGWALLLVYWALALPARGQEVAFLIQQYPTHRNIALRLLEPLGTPEADGPDENEVTVPDVAGRGGRAAAGRAAAGGAAAGGAAAGGAAAGVSIRIRGAAVIASGQALITIDALDLAPGEHVAVVGPSGAGKSSLAGVLLGWHHPAVGEVLVDGWALTGAHLAAVRGEAVWVEPAVYLWNRSLLENLRYGSEDGPTAVSEAIGAAELEDVLGRLPVGLQTSLGEGGTLLSGGEGQRVRFGRGVQRTRVRLVVLDEAFRGLERPRRQRLLARARARWAAATIVHISHDLAETAGFPRVLVVDGGRIVEDGAPAALAADPASRYARLLAAERAVQARLGGPGWRTWSLLDGRVFEEEAAGRAQGGR